MNRQDIIDMAQEAGFSEGMAYSAAAHDVDQIFKAWPHELEKFAALAIAHDRQRLAVDVEIPKPEAWMYFHNRMETPLDVQLEEPDCIKSFESDVTWKKQLFTLDQLRDHGDRRAAAAMEEANRKANASWTLMCEKMVKAEREVCAVVCDAKAAKWRKEAHRHLPHYNSEQAKRDFARAAICDADAAAIRARGIAS